jgi:hypothetical protein
MRIVIADRNDDLTNELSRILEFLPDIKKVTPQKAPEIRLRVGD